MKTTKFEIAVAGYVYRFKTYARDGVEALVKVKCFFGQPNAECTIRPSTSEAARADIAMASSSKSNERRFMRCRFKIPTICRCARLYVIRVVLMPL